MSLDTQKSMTIKLTLSDHLHLDWKKWMSGPCTKYCYILSICLHPLAQMFRPLYGDIYTHTHHPFTTVHMYSYIYVPTPTHIYCNILTHTHTQRMLTHTLALIYLSPYLYIYICIFTLAQLTTTKVEQGWRYINRSLTVFSQVLFTNPSARAGYDTRSIFKRSLTGLNSEFSFS